MAVRVITDSTSYIKPRIRQALKIEVVSLYVSFPETSLKETELENETFYPLMEEKGIPVSSQPPLGRLYQALENAVAQGDEVLGIFLSSAMSGTYAGARRARKMVLEKYPAAKIELVDSRSNSMQLGFAAMVAARAAKEGKSLAQVKKAAEDNIERSRFLFIPDNLVYLQRGGRIGGARALIGNLLKIIPVLTVEKGVTTVLKTVRTKGRAVAAMMEKMMRDHAAARIREIAVHHINCFEQAQAVAEKVGARLRLPVEIVAIGPVIGLHVGPGAIGIVYYTERPLR